WAAGSFGDPVAKPIIQSAVDRVGTDVSPTRARLLSALAAAHDAALEWQTRRELSLLALETARRAGDDATFVDVADACHLPLDSPDRREQQIEALEHAVTLADRIGDPVLRLRIRWSMPWAFYQRVDINGADALLTEIEALTETVRLPRQRWQLAITI